MHSPTRRDALIRFAGVAALSAAGAACSTMKPESPAVRDRFVTYESFKSGQIAARNVVVWLPADYDTGTASVCRALHARWAKSVRPSDINGRSTVGG